MKPLSRALRKSLELATQTYSQNLELASGYLMGRGIGRDTSLSHRLGVVVDPISEEHALYIGRLVIPYLGPGDHPYALKFRCMIDHVCADHGHSKYLNEATETRLFNTREVHNSGDWICITEGEFDTITLTQLGYSSVGVPGANAWKPHHRRIFLGFTRVFVFGDGDEPGRKFVRKVTSSLDAAVPVVLAPGVDVSSLYVASGREAIDKILRQEIIDE